MCQNCVDSGLMTQKDLDEGRSPLAAVLGSGSLEDAPAFIKELLGGAGGPKDPEAEAQEMMDRQVASILKFHAERRAKLATVEIELDTAEKLATFTEGAAMELMFRQDQSAIAWTLAILLERYVSLLGDWADLYVKAHADDEDGLDLDSITASEGREALQAKLAESDPNARTGFYL
jgi:hypothetical protein